MSVPLVCITAGHSTSLPAELLGSRRFAEFVEGIRHAYDVVVFDSAPVLPVGDTLELLTHVDEILMCIRLGRTTRDQAQAARAAIDRLPDRPTGVVITDIKPSELQSYYGGYGYQRGAASSAR
jgi:Mrp family chromosome partitioning ATPase